MRKSGYHNLQRWLCLTWASYQEGVAVILLTDTQHHFDGCYSGESLLKTIFPYFSYYGHFLCSFVSPFFFFLRLDANKPMRYLENKAALNEALERLNWPISLKELSMLENEILAGKMYIQQAMELQEATMKEDSVSRAPAEVGTVEVSLWPPFQSRPFLYWPAFSLPPTTLIAESFSVNPMKVQGLLSTGIKMLFDFTVALFLKQYIF